VSFADQELLRQLISVMLNALFESISFTGSANKSTTFEAKPASRATAVKKDKYCS
jgi:hypothetical protein